jgi:hypothetical protein
LYLTRRCKIFSLKGQDIESYQEENIQILGEHLLVAAIRREQAGSYYCSATSDLRTAVSKPLPIIVRCKIFLNLIF